MKKYLTGPDAVEALHKNGYTQDFQLLRDGLLWVQEKVFINAGEFAILECLKISPPERVTAELNVFGIFATYFNIKGILLSHCNRQLIRQCMPMDQQFEIELLEPA
jgi:hypothetical protein